MPCWASDMSGKYGTKKLFQTIPTGLACAHLASGIRHPASDIWQLATGIWYLASGMETGMPPYFWAKHVASVCMEPHQCLHLLALVAYSLKPVKFFGPCKRTQHCWPKTPNITQQCCDLLRPFAWALNPRRLVSK